MKDALALLGEELALLTAEWSGAMHGCLDTPSGASPATPRDTRRQVSRMTDDGVLRVVARLRTLEQAVDAARLALAGEVVQRSDHPQVGVEGMARRHGYRRPADLLAEAWAIRPAEASRLCMIGAVTRPCFEFPGGASPTEFPAVARAVDGGTLGIAAAASIVNHLTTASPRCLRTDRDIAERGLVEAAAAFTPIDLEILARQVRDRIDADGPPISDRLRRGRRALRMTPHTGDLTRLIWEMPAETAGLVKAGIDAVVGEQLRRNRALNGGVRFDEAASDTRALRHTVDECPDLALCDDEHLVVAHGSESGDGIDDLLGDEDRTLPQLRSDAAEQIFRHAATCDDPGGDLPAISMVVRVIYDDLVRGVGLARVDGIEAELPASAVRQLAAEAEIIPMVLGGAGEVLDVGHARRLFTRAQKLALADRDGGCGAGGCSTPPAYTEAHHIAWWQHGGPTDLDNGVLLCPFHHHRIHEGGWSIEVRDGVPWFIPPPWLGGAEKARRGGRPHQIRAAGVPPARSRPPGTAAAGARPARLRAHYLDPEIYIPEDLVGRGATSAPPAVRGAPARATPGAVLPGGSPPPAEHHRARCRR